jgi:hypothetical protein
VASGTSGTEGIITLTKHPLNVVNPPAPQGDGAPDRSIDITPAMIGAGVYAAKECCLGEGLETLVSRVFLAMRTEELDTERSSLVDKPRQIGDKETTNC